MKAGPDQKRTAEFREAAVRQVLDGARCVPQVARSLQMSARTLANWVARARRGQPLLCDDRLNPPSTPPATIGRRAPPAASRCR
jgi:transposase